MPGCKEYEQRILESMDSSLHSNKNKDLQRHIDACQPCRKLARRMQQLKKRLRVMPNVEASPDFMVMLKQRIRKDYRRNQREIIPMILGLERWMPALGIAGLLLIIGIWLVENRVPTVTDLPDKVELSEIQYVLEEPIGMPVSENAAATDTLFQNVQSVEAGLIPVSF
jgi:hypothetical protein